MYQDYLDKLPARLAQLRTEKNVTARKMSLDIGQNCGYINDIENNKTLPSMEGFFYICDYLKITPSDFFENESQKPEKLQHVMDKLKNLDNTQLDSVAYIIEKLVK